MASTGEVIKYIRKKHCLTQEELGDILGVKKSAIQKYENGTISNLKIDVIRKFCLQFQCPPWALIFPEYIDMEKYDKKIDIIVSDLFLLDHEGKQKAISYIKDLLLAQKYREIERISSQSKK